MTALDRALAGRFEMFQDAATFAQDEAIPVAMDRGWLLVIEGQKD